jgi:uncharacterized repeat protein (TIGR03803 family)
MLRLKATLAAVCGLLLSSCNAASNPTVPATELSGRFLSPMAGGYKVLHSFGKGTDGIQPAGPLLAVGDKLYGTTVGGGAYGEGTVFELSPSGAERILHSFHDADGAQPYGGLADVGGVLYGTASYGGENNEGAVFAITPAGKERVIFNFARCTEGVEPVAGLIARDGVLYGTTYSGGSGCDGNGIVFSMTTSGKERVLHTFAGGKDGANPWDGLATELAPASPFYGTTWAGGSSSDGTVFAVSGGGKEHVVHTFTGGNDGVNPHASLIDYNGELYGTTEAGGADNEGTIFETTSAGHERVVYTFTGESDGGVPEAPLLVHDGQLYGTATVHDLNTGGTLFTVTTAGKLRVLHVFGAGHDGAQPEAGLIYHVGTLYGTTAAGGRWDKGTVFAISP